MTEIPGLRTPHVVDMIFYVSKVFGAICSGIDADLLSALNINLNGINLQNKKP